MLLLILLAYPSLKQQCKLKDRGNLSLKALNNLQVHMVFAINSRKMSNKHLLTPVRALSIDQRIYFTQDFHGETMSLLDTALGTQDRQWLLTGA